MRCCKIRKYIPDSIRLNFRLGVAVAEYLGAETDLSLTAELQNIMQYFSILKVQVFFSGDGAGRFMWNVVSKCVVAWSHCVVVSGGRKSKSGFANPVFNTVICQIVFGFGLYLRLQYQILFGFGLYLRDLVYWNLPNLSNQIFGFGLYLQVVDLDCIYMRNSFEYLDLDFIYGLC